MRHRLPITFPMQYTVWTCRQQCSTSTNINSTRLPISNSHSLQSVHLNILIHAQIVALFARVLAPYIGGNRTEEAHEQLHGDNESNLKIEEAIV